jgi:GAF domain-containing protein
MGKLDEYNRINDQLLAYFEGETDLLANMANCAAILFLNLSDLNLAGFYLTQGTDLVLGPFQGKPACTRIAFGRGVCGTAAARRETVVVQDVHEFPGHIACDAASNSEIVIPLIVDTQVIGVLDLDSPFKNRFDTIDRDSLQTIVADLLRGSKCKSQSLFS